MKTRSPILLIAFLFLISAFSVVSCKKIEDGNYVDPITLYEKVKGNWTLNEILQVDETAKTAGITPDEISLAGQFGFDSFKIALNVDDSNQPASYEVSGNAPELFPNKGYWDIDTSFPYADGTAPTINLYSDAARTGLTGKLRIVSVPGAKPEMELKLTRSTGGVPFVSYQYKLSTANQ